MPIGNSQTGSSLQSAFALVPLPGGEGGKAILRDPSRDRKECLARAGNRLFFVIARSFFSCHCEERSDEAIAKRAA